MQKDNKTNEFPNQLWELVSTCPVKNQQENVSIAFLLQIVKDIKKLQQTHEALQQAYAQLERQVEERTQELIKTNEALQAEIAQRQQTQAELMLYKQAVESSSDAIGIADAAGNHIYQNSAFSKLYECETVQDFMKFGGFSAVFTNSAVAKEIWQVTISGKSWIGEVEQQSASGRIMQTFLRSYSLKDCTGKNVGLVGAVTDITERKLAEVQLQQKEQFLRTVYEGAEHLIFVVDVLEDGDFLFTGWNPATERTTGISSTEVIGKTPEDVVGVVEGIAVRQRYISCVEAGTPITYEECLTFQGEEVWSLTTINPLKDSKGRIYRLVGTTVHITERIRAETQLKQQAEDLEKALDELQQTQMQLVQSEKMSGLGQLVAGVAHEINNPVNFIYGNLAHANDYIQDLVGFIRLYQQLHPHPISEIEELATDIDLEFLIEDLPKLFNSMKIGAQRIREIVLSLRNFSRMDEADMKEVNIHEGIDSTLMILEHRIKATPDRPAIQIIKEYSNLPLVECYAGQLNQVFMNILANAIDALEEAMGNAEWGVGIGEMGKCGECGERGGKDFFPILPHFLLAQCPMPHALCLIPTIRIHTELTREKQVVIRIADNGLGIPKQVKQRLFDPFFSTKPIGKGTGMGLSISYQIISQKHGGSLECISQPGSGAEFVVTIPLSQK
ncbi:MULTISPECIES: PAS domain S-box protein [Nostoc]|uniref:histidine kinase n=1 Tax=Nostoc paludosum FACHB-159 TaxID=2692908 RepID=A0ABR8K9U7_9NOSO|nr:MULTISPECIES: PAS domain S-box protein [Nostoc]MBD2680025.1 PAS domain S-box protein [Nostoc sp. FACHB-857]MBD2736281.1 PAS domain S-box protein [Nostoc paludosum FACHB-159]